MGANRLVFIRSLRKHAILRKYAEIDEKAAAEFDRKFSDMRETADTPRNNT